jgi:hypothetical protein
MFSYQEMPQFAHFEATIVSRKDLVHLKNTREYVRTPLAKHVTQLWYRVQERPFLVQRKTCKMEEKEYKKRTTDH